MPASIKQPIFLIGAARSGTTFIADCLAQHPDIAYWVEPKYVWRHGAASRRDDIRSASDATPAVKAYIQKSFLQHLNQESDKSRFMEKTPSNCFRIPFMHAVFPDGLFLHVIRDGCDTAWSAYRRWTTPPDDKAILRRIKNWEIPLSETLSYAPDMIREALLRRLRPDAGFTWGPKYPDIAKDAQAHGPAYAAAKQWSESVNHAMEALKQAPSAQQFSFRYEDFLADPERLLKQISDFLKLTESRTVAEYASSHALRQSKPVRSINPPELEIFEKICQPTMDLYGL